MLYWSKAPLALTHRSMWVWRKAYTTGMVDYRILYVQDGYACYCMLLTQGVMNPQMLHAQWHRHLVIPSCVPSAFIVHADGHGVPAAAALHASRQGTPPTKGADCVACQRWLLMAQNKRASVRRGIMLSQVATRNQWLVHSGLADWEACSVYTNS